MGVAIHARTVEVILQVVLLAGSHADVGNVRERVELAAKREPRLARRRTVPPLIEPPARDARRERVGEHRGARRLAPVARIVRTVDQLSPETIRTLELQQRLHHRVVPLEDPCAVFTLSRHAVEDERHARRHPPVAAAPHILDVRRMVEESSRRPFLQLKRVEVETHLLCRTIDVLTVARGAERLTLQHGDHVHVVDPETSLRRVSLCPEILLRLF